MFSTQEGQGLARRFGCSPLPPSTTDILGMADNVRGELWPLNGLWHPVSDDASGWYVWAGEELSRRADFFQPIHVGHLESIRPIIVPYLALPPGIASCWPPTMRMSGLMRHS